jgi:hypothetical protein
MKHIKLFEAFDSLESPKGIVLCMTDRYKKELKSEGCSPTDGSYGYPDPDEITLFDNTDGYGKGEFNLVQIYRNDNESSYNDGTVIRTWVSYNRKEGKLYFYDSFFDFKTDREMNFINLSSYSPYFNGNYKRIDDNQRTQNSVSTEGQKRDQFNFFNQSSYSDFENGVLVGETDYRDRFEIIEISE